MRGDLGALSARYHRAFNDRDFDVWREVFDEDVELLIDGMSFRGVDAAVAYGVESVSQFPGLYIAVERIVAESGDTIVTEIDLVTGDQIRDSRLGTAVDSRADALLRFAREVVETRGRVTDRDIEDIRAAGFDDGAIAEVVAHVALNIFTNYFNQVAGTNLDFPKVPAL